MSIVNRSEDDIYILDVIVRNNSLETIAAFVDYGKKGEREALIPVSTLLSILEIYHETNFSKGNINGWIINEKRKFKIDLKKKIITTSDKRKSIKLNSSMVELHKDEIYLNSKVFKQFLPFDALPQYNRSVLDIESKEPLPLEVRIDKEIRRENLIKEPSLIALEKLDYAANRDKFSLPFLDLNTSYTSTNQTINNVKNQRGENWNYSVTGRQILFGMDSTWSLNAYSDAKEPGVDVMLKKYYYDNRERPFDKIRQIELGDIYSYSAPGVTGQEQGRGFRVSSLHGSDITRTTSIDLNGLLSKGWEVEVYRNDTLIDFIAESSNGRYEFNKLPVTTGRNDFKLIFYGPQGQVREEVRSYLIKNQSVLENEFGFEVSATQDDRYLIEYNDDERDQTQKDTSFVLNTTYGITDNFSFDLGTALLRDPSKSSTSVLDQNIETNFLLTGFKSYVQPFAFNYTSLYSLDNDDFAHDFLVNIENKKFIPAKINLEYQHFDNIKTSESIFFGQFTHHIINSRINSKLRFGKEKKYIFPLELAMERGVSYDDRRFAYRLYSRISHNIAKKYNLTVLVDRDRNYNNTVSSDLEVMLNRRFKKVGIRGEMEYDLNPDRHLSSLRATLNYYPWNNRSRFYGKWQENYSYTRNEAGFNVKNTLDSYALGTSYKTEKAGNYGLEFNWNTDDLKSISFTYSIGLGFDQYQKKLITNSNGLSGAGLVSPRVFIDENRNDVFDEGDEPIEGATFKKKKQAIKTNKDGFASIRSTSLYRADQISTKDGTYGDDIFLTQKDEYKYYVARPGSIVRVDIPIIRVGDIEGEVLNASNNSGAKNIQVILLDKQGKVVQKTKTDREGFFVFSDIPLGEYQVKVNADQIKKLQYKKTKSVKIVLDKDEPVFAIDTIKLRRKGDAQLLDELIDKLLNESIEDIGQN